MTRGKRNIEDQLLPNGSIILWSQHLKIDGRYCVAVRCGVCGEKRIVGASGIHHGFSGLCRQCSTTARRTLGQTGEQVLPNGSVIYWNHERYDERSPTARRVVTVRCGGKYCNGSTRPVPVHIAAQPDFTGLCRRCAHYGPASGRWKGGTKRNKQGYILVKLLPEHPLYGMTDKNGYVLEHRFVVARKIGRPLRNDEIVHHLNGKKDDNRPENLQLLVEHHHAGYQVAPEEDA